MSKDAKILACMMACAFIGLIGGWQMKSIWRKPMTNNPIALSVTLEDGGKLHISNSIFEGFPETWTNNETPTPVPADSVGRVIFSPDGCSQLMESRLRTWVLKHPVWDGVIDMVHTKPPYSDEYEAGFDAAFNIALSAIQAYKWDR